jgi:hypothetical protein
MNFERAFLMPSARAAEPSVLLRAIRAAALGCLTTIQP